ncbi:MAG: hypothetical protein KGZ93_05650 [Actinobacteria bacterium]|nr:hypothetical protein [Actinomycetota bacterium]
MKINIDNLTEKELIELNHRIVERLKFLDSMRAHVEMMEFSIGDRVSFKTNGRERKEGLLIKYNKKTVTVITDQGEKWNISPNLLSRVESSSKRSKPSKVISLNERKSSAPEEAEHKDHLILD